MEMFEPCRSRFDRDDQPLTAHALEAVAAAGWRVIFLAERSAHLVVGQGGAFMVVTEDRAGAHWAQLFHAQAGVARLVVRWRPFPEEVAETDGVFLVHGDVLLDFLLAQRGLLDTYEAD